MVKMTEQKYYLYWCGSCAGSIRESPPHLTKIHDYLVEERKHRCDCCGNSLAIWKKEVTKKDWIEAIKVYSERINRLRRNR